MPEKLADNLDDKNRATWDWMGAGWQGALQHIYRKHLKRGDPVSMNMLVQLWEWQRPEDAPGPVCAGFSIPLAPGGPASARLFRITQEQGWEPGNLCLVSALYFSMRNSLRVFGQTGHRKMIDMVSAATLDPEQSLEDPLGRAETE